MDPSSKNWFVLFCDEFQNSVLRNSHLLDTYVYSHKKSTDFAHFYLHYSGLFYGCTNNSRLLCNFPTSESWNAADHFKISLTEGLFLTYLHFRKKQSMDEDIATVVMDCVRKIYEFYVLFTMNDTMAKKYRTIYNKVQNAGETVEQVIDFRVSNPTMLKRDFWRGSQFNIFSGLDVLYFASWLQSEYAYDRRDVFKKEVIAIMNRSCAIDSLENNAQSIVSYFIASGNFAADEVAGLESYTDFDENESLKEDTYLYRLLLYEYASYICLCESMLGVKKVLFLNSLAQNLELQEDDIQQSMITIENFLLNKGDKIFYLHYGEGIDLVRKAFINRCQDFILKNKKKIVTEILESKELVELIRKSVTEELSDEEKQKVKEQIFDLLKTIPSLAIFMLPGAVVILPLIMKIIPEEILMPSSFVNKKNKDSLL